MCIGLDFNAEYIVSRSLVNPSKTNSKAICISIIRVGIIRVNTDRKRKDSGHIDVHSLFKILFI
jgi:hypothetical protein